MKLHVRVLIALALLLALAPAAHATRKPLFTHPVHRGSRGAEVAAAQWLLQGNDPNGFRKFIRPLRGHPVTGQFGKRTARAVLTARWLLGEPIGFRKYCHCRPGKRAVFDRDLYLLLTNRRTRPLRWKGREAQRIQAVARQHGAGSACAQRVVSNARHELALGVHEVPDRSNDGPRIRVYQRTTGAFGCPGRTSECPLGQWCESFVQAIDLWSGIGTLAGRTAAVFAAEAWANARGWVRARPVIGAQVAFMRGQGHTGVVVGVGRTVFTTIEGNSHNAVREHVYPLGWQQTVFIVPPCVARGAR